ncbi:MAG: Ig-like domain-containing protein [Planctomycetes bacterium]|nr:Ig-like domain-containing protein [Planctomycetota bacterium]
MDRSHFRILLCALALVACPLTACQPPAEAPFDLTNFLQGGATGHPVNGELTWVFNQPVDPGSVHGGGIRIALADSAPGERVTAGKLDVLPNGRVRFLPALPSRVDYADGGLQPGRTYTVEIMGFPRASGVRSSRGQVLSKSHRFEFTTAPLRQDSTLALLVDHSPWKGPVLTVYGASDPAAGGGEIASVLWHRGAALELATDEPLAPHRVTADNFQLIGIDDRGSRRPIALLDPVLRNDTSSARIELRTVAPLDGYSAVSLEVSDRVTDFGGNPCRLLDGRQPRFEIIPAPSYEPSSIIEEFLYVHDRSTPETFDPQTATATWAGDGALRAHFPKAAGDGRDGHIALRGELGTRLLQASSIDSLPTDEGRLVLPSCIGCAGSLDLRGVLSARREGTHEPAWERVDGLMGPWDLALVAGGDLHISGRITTPGTLLLVAGGAVRVAASARIECTKLRIIAPAGMGLAGDLSGVKEREFQRTPLLDATSFRSRPNLRYVSTSKWIRMGGRLVTIVGARAESAMGSGDVALRVRTARSLPAPNPETAAMDPRSATPWADPAERLPPGQWMQFQIEISLLRAGSGPELVAPVVDRAVFEISTR